MSLPSVPASHPWTSLPYTASCPQSVHVGKLVSLRLRFVSETQTARLSLHVCRRDEMRSYIWKCLAHCMYTAGTQ